MGLEGVIFFVLFAALMLGGSFVVNWLFSSFSYWLIIPWGAFFLFAAWRIDQRDKRRREANH